MIRPFGSRARIALPNSAANTNRNSATKGFAREAQKNAESATEGPLNV